MVGWIITGAVLLLFLLILISPVVIAVDYGEELFVNVSYFGFTVFQIPRIKRKSPKKRKKTSRKKSGKDKADKKKAKKDAADKKDKKEKEKPTLDELLELVRLALDSVGKPLRRILKRTEFSHLNLNIVCGGDDAARAAINYGAANFALGSALTLIDSFFTLNTPDEIHVGVDFYSEKTTFSIYVEVKLTVGAALAFAFSLIGRFLRFYCKRPQAKAAIGKLAG